MMEKIAKLRVKCDLHMGVERYVSDGDGIPEGGGLPGIRTFPQKPPPYFCLISTALPWRSARGITISPFSRQNFRTAFPAPANWVLL